MKKKTDALIRKLIVKPDRRISLRRDYDPAYRPKRLDKKSAAARLEEGIKLLARHQDVLYAQNTYALLVVLQAMDAAGKDSTIKHVMTGLNPQGCQVHSFKVPSVEELDHDYLWRYVKALPERGRIGIFNRSYYEEVLVVRVHPELFERQHLPPTAKAKDNWEQRFREINDFERYLVRNGIVVLKFFLHLSREEQKKRFLERIDRPEKNWKFSEADARERAHWNEYMAAYEDVFNHTSTAWAPWYVIPADHKWFARLAVAAVIYRRLQQLDLRYPRPSDDHRRQLAKARKFLEREK